MKLFVAALAALGLTSAAPQFNLQPAAGPLLISSAPVPVISTSRRIVDGQTVKVVKKPRTYSTISQVYNSPDNEGRFNYAFETENGIKQEAQGEMQVIDEAPVLIMRGSYEFPGADGLIYTVDWEADHLGFRASAPHLPVAPEIPFPEQAEAVAAQIAFAAANPQPIEDDFTFVGSPIISQF